MVLHVRSKRGIEVGVTPIKYAAGSLGMHVSKSANHAWTMDLHAAGTFLQLHHRHSEHAVSGTALTVFFLSFNTYLLFLLQV
jgi:dihydrodipicolinate reductase